MYPQLCGGVCSLCQLSPCAQPRSCSVFVMEGANSRPSWSLWQRTLYRRQDQTFYVGTCTQHLLLIWQVSTKQRAWEQAVKPAPCASVTNTLIYSLKDSLTSCRLGSQCCLQLLALHFPWLDCFETTIMAFFFSCGMKLMCHYEASLTVFVKDRLPQTQKGSPFEVPLSTALS